MTRKKQLETNKEYFIVKGVRNDLSEEVRFLSPSTAGSGLFYWAMDRGEAARYESERSAYLAALRHIGISVAYVLYETIRVVRVYEKIDEEVLET